MKNTDDSYLGNDSEKEEGNIEKIKTSA